MIFLQQIRENRGADGFDGADAQPSGKLRRFRKRRPGPRHVRDQTPRVLREHYPLVGQRHLLSDPVKQPRPQLLLQMLDLYGHGRLGIPQLLRRPAETF